MKKIPHGAKVVNIMIGELDVLDTMVGAFIRLKVRVILFTACSETIRRKC